MGAGLAMATGSQRGRGSDRNHSAFVHPGDRTDMMLRPAIERFTPAASCAGAALLALSIMASSASAQSKAEAERAGDAGNDRLIISNMPERKRPVRDLFSKVLGKAKRRVLALTKSEVWSG